ncbi:hypothetical protein C5167_004134 [Papaver somniferum]|nr:hypothetical protein C5167_004134 [Papaver somniferum]
MKLQFSEDYGIGGSSLPRGREGQGFDALPEGNGILKQMENLRSMELRTGTKEVTAELKMTVELDLVEMELQLKQTEEKDELQLLQKRIE